MMKKDILATTGHNHKIRKFESAMDQLNPSFANKKQKLTEIIGQNSASSSVTPNKLQIHQDLLNDNHSNMIQTHKTSTSINNTVSNNLVQENNVTELTRNSLSSSVGENNVAEVITDTLSSSVEENNVIDLTRNSLSSSVGENNVTDLTTNTLSSSVGENNVAEVITGTLSDYLRGGYFPGEYKEDIARYLEYLILSDDGYTKLENYFVLVGDHLYSLRHIKIDKGQLGFQYFGTVVDTKETAGVIIDYTYQDIGGKILGTMDNLTQYGGECVMEDFFEGKLVPVPAQFNFIGSNPFGEIKYNYILEIDLASIVRTFDYGGLTVAQITDYLSGILTFIF